jgi:hypothetical protein
MLPAHVRDPAMAVIWITGWLDRLGAVTMTDVPITVFSEPSGLVARVRVDAKATFSDGRVLHVRVELDGHLEARAYRFDLVSGSERRWGWHGHPEPVGFHHRHLPPDFTASPSPAATFEEIEELVHGGDLSG